MGGDHALHCCNRAHATPARAATSSTYTQYATPRTLTAGELAVLDCDAAAQYPGSDAAAGAPDGAGWTVDTSASQCAGTPDEAFLVPDFTRLRCTSYVGITGLHVRAVTLPGQTISLTGSEWVVGVIANNSLVPFATGEIDSAGGTSDIDFSFIAPTNTAAIFNPAVTMVFGLDSKENLIYDIDAFSFVITGDLSACHIDQDGDGLDNVAEKAHGTDPLSADTDGGGVDDGTEVARAPIPWMRATTRRVISRRRLRRPPPRRPCPNCRAPGVRPRRRSASLPRAQ